MKLAMQMVADTAAETARATAAGLSFGRAGGLCVGPDAELRQGCAAMLEMFQWFVTRGKPIDYERVVRRVEARAAVVAPLSATTPEGMRAKAAIVRTLCDLGMAGYAERILAAALARDVLGEMAEAQL
jgi:hypothetical protein